jgi:hypothetical protein
MPGSFKSLTRRALEVAIAVVPWLFSMYLLYWLKTGEIWAPETAHRGKTSVAILAVGMGLSFFVYSYFLKRRQK